MVICLLCSTFGFEQGFWKSNTESVPIIKMGTEGGKDGTLFLHRDFLAFHHVLILLFSNELSFHGAMLVLAQFCSTDDISIMISHFVRIKIFTTVYAVVGS